MGLDGISGGDLADLDHDMMLKFFLLISLGYIRIFDTTSAMSMHDQPWTRFFASPALWPEN